MTTHPIGAVPLPAAAPDRRFLIFGILLFCVFMATLDNLIVSAALPRIVSDLGGIERFAWIGSAYLLAQSTVMPLYGKMGDLFGRKRLLMTAVALFTLGSALCGLAWSMESLIAARVLQGLGGGGIMVTVFAVNADLFAPRERARYQSYTSLVLMLSASIGPALGGTLSDAFGWRSIFYVNVPFGLIALAALQILLPLRRSDRKPVIDFAGAITLALAVAGLVLWTDSEQVFGSLLAWPALAILAVAVVSALVWLRVERRAVEPIIPPALLTNRTFATMMVAGIASGGIAIGMVNFHALFLQMTTGLAPAKAGLFFIAITGGVAAGSMLAGRFISRTGRVKAPLVMGLAISAVALSVVSFLPLGTPLPLIAAVLLVQGFGVGLAQQAPVIAVQSAAPQRDVGAATGAITLSRIAGAALAISAYGALLGLLLSQSALAGSENLSAISPEALAAMTTEARAAVAGAYAFAFSWLYRAAAGLALVGLVAAALLPRQLIGATTPK